MRKILAVIIAVIFGLLIKNYVVQAYKIPAGSMMPTLLVGDHIFVSKNHYKKNSIERGDIVVFRFPEDKEVDFVKRVIGLPGETISIKENIVYINETPINEEYAIYEQRERKNDYEPFDVPADHVFMLGDNRDNSYDSRFQGPVKIEDVKGKVTRIYWSIDGDNDNKNRWDRVWDKVE